MGVTYSLPTAGVPIDDIVEHLSYLTTSRSIIVQLTVNQVLLDLKKINVQFIPETKMRWIDVITLPQTLKFIDLWIKTIPLNQINSKLKILSSRLKGLRSAVNTALILTEKL